MMLLLSVNPIADVAHHYLRHGTGFFVLGGRGLADAGHEEVVQVRVELARNVGPRAESVL